MVSGPTIGLAGTTAKQKAEAANFEVFWRSAPNFAGRTLKSVTWGGDPPDVLCMDDQGNRVGVELVQWLNEAQTAASKKQFSLEKSYNDVIQSASVEPPANIGFVFLYARLPLAAKDSGAFRKELYDCVEHVAAKYPEWEDPQGYLFNDFGHYPCLSQHLDGLDFYSDERRSHAQLGIDWIGFRSHGGAYTTDWMRDALLENIERKIAKYAKPHNKLKLEQQRLSEFYLLAYYDEAVLHNTPYDAPGFGFREIVAIAANKLAVTPHPFDKVFICSPLEQPSVQRVWPTE